MAKRIYENKAHIVWEICTSEPGSTVRRKWDLVAGGKAAMSGQHFADLLMGIAETIRGCGKGVVQLTRPSVNDKTAELMRELETHLAAVQVTVKSGGQPFASINCARQILLELMQSAGMGANNDLPEIDDDDTEAILSLPPST